MAEVQKQLKSSLKQSIWKWLSFLAIFSIKVTIVVIVFFAWLVLDIQPLDQPLTYQMLFTEFVDEIIPQPLDEPKPFDQKEIQDNIDSILRPILHEAWDAAQDDVYWDAMLESSCKIVEWYCDKILNFGTRSKKEKYTYNSLALYYMATIDNKINRKNTLKETLKTLELKKDIDKDRWLAGHSLVRINLWKIKSLQEFVEVLTHELGHVVDLWVLEWTTSKAYDAKFTEFGEPAFRTDDISLWFYELSRESEKTRKKTITEWNFCSWYGSSNPFEDFAEHFNCYLNHNSFFFELANVDPVMFKKYQFFAKLFENDYISAPKRDFAKSTKYAQDGTRPWDTTRM